MKKVNFDYKGFWNYKVIKVFIFGFFIFSSLLISSCASDDNAIKFNSPEELAKIKIVDNIATAEPKLIIDSTIDLLPDVYSVIHDGKGNIINDSDRLQVQTDTYQSDDNQQYKISNSSWQGKDAANVLVMSQTQGAMPDGLYNQLIGKKVGTIFIVGTGSQNSQNGLTTNYIMVNKVVGKAKGYTTADGQVMSVDNKKPSATLTSNNQFTLNLPANYKASAQLQSYYLIKGTGPKVKSTDTITVKYTGWLSNGTQFDSKTDSSFVASLNGSVIQGWTNGLKDKTVGSRVMLVIPPKLGYGQTAIGQIPANSSLIFCIDILGIN
ncbi:MAG: FKBP-type peptidyl-prolyl cis-trans isomerase [Bifidobacteriaceae bacterium]|jgi:FKBP-type peptidyl-prolyl cis-trans isomerase|nr:FKBP-type peptidyl-prolyl cis-trans isomerase [Bifidobacteriaceae bacterium]